jgi:hypothetical protein
VQQVPESQPQRRQRVPARLQQQVPARLQQQVPAPERPRQQVRARRIPELLRQQERLLPAGCSMYPGTGSR